MARVQSSFCDDLMHQECGGGLPQGKHFGVVTTDGRYFAILLEDGMPVDRVAHALIDMGQGMLLPAEVKK
ncbi:hypothetical protein [Methylophilus sp. YYY-1]|uniref:hypothetical protein n=1 Tax=Methylophilus sp. YYY-1 TaxID=2682087 RepID=UPI0023B2BF3B|nr:hypothetical protein [Methylophilus sp. YYY-1]MDF0377676.1 hypothetical protein [Methylophilus sp. YYY-1]